MRSRAIAIAFACLLYGSRIPEVWRPGPGVVGYMAYLAPASASHNPTRYKSCSGLDISGERGAISQTKARRGRRDGRRGEDLRYRGGLRRGNDERWWVAARMEKRGVPGKRGLLKQALYNVFSG